MIGALWTGISGLSSQQKALDNESNNIANVNTVGYKSSRISFADQMYQSKIGKGSIVQDAEKLFVQGNTKITGVEYDMMLEGDGFFTVINKNTLGTAESFYTRAGNFRMGDNGTLQDAGGNEVQGWIMSPIDAQKDVTTTSPNTSVFTNEYTKMLGSKIVRHGTYVETITAKATDYGSTAKSDATSIFSGDGAKTKSSKVSDIEEAIKDYNSWLQKLKEEPDAVSASSITQISQIDFKSGNDSIIGKDGDAVYVRINGDKISQEFLVTTASPEFRVDLWNSLTPSERNAEGLANPTLGSPAGSNLTPAELAAYDKAAGKIATYKALSDKISNRLPVEATMAIDSNKNGTFNVDTAYTESTYIGDMLKGIIQIKGLIPGHEFKITEVGEESGNRTVLGNYQTTALAVKGSGTAALESSKNALAQLITGKQQDVFTPKDLGIDGSLKSFDFSIAIYDKELGRNIPIPNDGASTPLALPLPLSGDSIDDFKNQINSDSSLNQYIEARNVNGNLVIQTKDSNYDVEFNSNLIAAPGMGIKIDQLVTPATYQLNLNINGTPLVVTVANPIDSSDLYTKIKNQIDNHNANVPNSEKIEVSGLSNGSFRVYPKDETASMTGTLDPLTGVETPALPAANISTSHVPHAMNVGTIAIAAAPSTQYSFNVMGETISFTSSAQTPVDPKAILDGLMSRINSNSNLAGMVSVSSNDTTTLTITQLKIKNPLDPKGLELNQGANTTSAETTPFAAGTEAVYTITPDFSTPTPPATSFSNSTFTLNLDGIDLKVDSKANTNDIVTALNKELARDPELSTKYKIETNGTDITITRLRDEDGTHAMVGPTLSASPISNPLNSSLSSFSSYNPVEANKDFSGREGAGAEFLEIITTVDQTSSQGSIQLRLDTLNISDSPFGEFSVDSTGLITMKQDGAEYAIGQVAIARFNNNRGLEPQGNNLFAKTSESGDPIYNINNNKMADVRGKALELSNADLSESLVNLMIFQRAFEANAKSITTSDELLNTLINLKR